MAETKQEWHEGMAVIEAPDKKSLRRVLAAMENAPKGHLVVRIPDGATFIKNYAFKDVDSIVTVLIPDTVTSIGEYAFGDCGYLKNIKIPETVTKIGEGAFKGCRNLTTINIPEAVTVIEAMTFSQCYSLTKLYIPERVTSIGAYAFSHCYKLESVNIPDSVTTIEEFAFSHCSGLTSIVVPKSVPKIGSSAFEYCTGLTQIVVPETLNEMKEDIFDGCMGYKKKESPKETVSSRTPKNTDKIFALKVKYDTAFDNLFFSTDFKQKMTAKFGVCPQGTTFDTSYDDDNSPVYFKIVSKSYGYEYSSFDRVVGDFMLNKYDYTQEMGAFLLEYIAEKDPELAREIYGYDFYL